MQINLYKSTSILLKLLSFIFYFLTIIIQAQDDSNKKQGNENIKYEAIEIRILSAIITEEEQKIHDEDNSPLTIHMTIDRNGYQKVTYTIESKTVKPKDDEAFGIIRFKITNKEEGQATINFNDIYLIINGERKTFHTQQTFSDSLVFCRAGNIKLDGGESKTERIIFTATKNDFTNSTLQYGNKEPLKIDFTIKGKK